MKAISRSNWKYVPFDYRRQCDTCGWTGWWRGQESIEPVTAAIVCHLCYDEPMPMDLGIIPKYGTDFSYPID